MCGVVGVIGLPKKETLSKILWILSLQQNRGQQGSGVYLAEFSSHQDPFHIRTTGLVTRLVSTIDESLEGGWPQPVGDIGLGHLRYSTSGSDDQNALQPKTITIDGTNVVLSFNGNLVKWKQNAIDLGLPRGITDTEYILELLKRSVGVTPLERIHRVFSALHGAFCVVIIWDNCLYAVRDPSMFRPLWLGQCNGGWIVASEDGALRHAKMKVVRYIKAGEVLQISTDGPQASLKLPQKKKKERCTMCVSYFARPDSTITSRTKSNGMLRYRHGVLLATAWKASNMMPAIDCIVPMVASGLHAATGVSQTLNLELRLAINRNPFLGRNFLMDRQNADSHVSAKHSVDPYMVKNKTIAVVDDSLIRGRTARRTIADLRSAGATEVHWLVATPPYRACCFYGLDTPFTSELLAYSADDNRSIDELSRRAAEAINADSVFYIPFDRYYSSFSTPEHCCFSCFTGIYPKDNLPDELDMIGQRCDIEAAPAH